MTDSNVPAAADRSAVHPAGGVTRRGQFARLDIIGASIGAAVMIATTLIAHAVNPFFWYDELATLSLVADRSMAHMVRAIANGAENNPPLYELLMRAWSAAFGTNELSLRLVTGLFAGAALVVLWFLLRRHYTTRATAAGIAVAFFGSEPLLDQLNFARFYGLFIFAVAIVLLVADSANRNERTGRRLLVATFFANLLLVFSHAFGGFYSAAILGALILADLLEHRFRPALYGSAVGAWLVFTMWVPAVISQGQMNQPRSWLVSPTRGDLYALLHRQTLWLPLAAIVLAVSQAVWRNRQVEREQTAADTEARYRTPLVLMGVALICLVPANFLLAKLSLPVFLDRYLLPSILGWGIIVAQMVNGSSSSAASRHGVVVGRHTPVGIVWAVFFGLLAAYPLIYAARKPRVERPALVVTDELRGLPVVVESAFDFWQMAHYADRGAQPYRYLLDWTLALDGANAKSAVQEYKLIDLYATERYILTGVVHPADFLCATSRFLVIDSPAYIWFERRIASDSSYQWGTVGAYHGMPVRLVSKKRPNCEVASPLDQPVRQPGTA